MKSLLSQCEVLKPLALREKRGESKVKKGEKDLDLFGKLKRGKGTSRSEQKKKAELLLPIP